MNIKINPSSSPGLNRLQSPHCSSGTQLSQKRGAFLIAMLLVVILVFVISVFTTKQLPDESKFVNKIMLQQQTSKHQVRQMISEMLEGIQTQPNFLKPSDVSVIRQRAIKNDIVFLSAGYSYREVLMNWIVNAERVGIKNWIICCFDSEINHWLRERGSRCHITIPKKFMEQQQPEILKDRFCLGQEGFTTRARSHAQCLFFACSGFYNTNCLGVSFTPPTGKNPTGTCVKCVGNPMMEFVSAISRNGTDIALYKGKGKIWHLRWLAAMDVLHLGINVAFVDLDAIVVKNFFPLLHSMPAADVVAQRGLGPSKAVALWGNSICMGFSYWRVGTRKRNEIIKNIEMILQRSGDDQSAVANALLIEGVRFPEMLQESDTEPMFGTSPSDYTLVMLPLTTFPRQCSGGIIQRNKQLVAHCIFGGNAIEKGNAIKDLGGWLLNTDYEEDSSSNTLNEYISRVTNKTTEECFNSGENCRQSGNVIT